MAPLIQGPFTRNAISSQTFFTNRAVGIRREREDMFYAQYSWTGKHSEGPDSLSFLRIDSPLRGRLPHEDEDLVGFPGACLFDQFSNRVVVTDIDATRFFTIFSTDFTAIGEGFSLDDIAESAWETPDYDSLSSDHSSVTSEGDNSPEDALDLEEDWRQDDEV